MTLKILSDFDGVWTDQLVEAEHASKYLIEAAARSAGIALEEARVHFAGFMDRIMEAPGSFGWAPDGRISAYVDEDPLLRSSSLALYLDTASEDPLALKYRSAILAGKDKTLPDFGNRCFIEATASFRDEHPPAIVAGADKVLEAWHATGAEVVIVSNSGADKIIGWLNHAGIDAGEDDGHLVRVRGNARKWEIGTDERVEFGGRAIYVDRPRYLEAIVDEKPDLIVGDVFSLDLALPAVMRRKGDERAPARLVLRRHPHTPAWVPGMAQQDDPDDPPHPPAVDALIDGLEGIVPIIEELQR